jgi:hypothetical protein
MKKVTVLLTASLLLLACSTFARNTDPTTPESINVEFSRDFAQAKNVEWEQTDNFYKATFDFNGKVLFAFYSDNADFMGVAYNLPSTKLPRSLQSTIEKSYANYWITDLFQYRTADADGFVITLENADKVVTLKSNGIHDWNLYHVVKKS